MRIVVTGCEGQVVRSLIERSVTAELLVVPVGRPELDLCASPEEIGIALANAKPDVIVSAAAYTQVDKAESEPGAAFLVNEQGPRAVARAARELDVPLLHISTDYVFDGKKNAPYTEDDAPNPTGVYGASKLAGEEAVLNEYGNCVVLRTAWVYSPFGSNFVKTMLRLASDRDQVSVVADQRGNPTSALDIADGIIRIAANLRASFDKKLRGVFHMTAAGEASWAEFAEAIFTASRDAGGPSPAVKHISAVDYPTPARRPANSRLDAQKLAAVHGVALPDWRSSLKEVVGRLVTDGRGMNR